MSAEASFFTGEKTMKDILPKSFGANRNSNQPEPGAVAKADGEQSKAKLILLPPAENRAEGGQAEPGFWRRLDDLVYEEFQKNPARFIFRLFFYSFLAIVLACLATPILFK